MANPGSSQIRSAKANTNHHAVRVLMHEFQSLQKEPMEGFRVKLLKDDNLFEWEVAIFGPPETLYSGGYFRALMKFPQEYPFSPPTVRFLTKLFHPNVYENGTVCISILHPPTDDPRSGELPCERWNPTQNVHSVLMSIISLLNEPNTSSPANVDASIMYRKFKEKGENEYERRVREQVEASKADAEKDGVKIPTTIEEYCVRKQASPTKPADNFVLPDNDDDEENYSYSDDEEPSNDGMDASVVNKRKEGEKGPSSPGSGSATKRPKSDSPRPDRN